MKKVVVIGGGTGTYTVLSGLKKYPLDLSVVVSMMDSGGSNRILRDEFGILPTSDIRQCLVALADESKNEVLRDLFTYRYSHGIGISGMTFGNLFMAALTDIYGSQKDAIAKTCELLNIKGQIIPVTYENVHLIARFENGRELLGEHFIDEPGVDNGRIVEFATVPKGEASDEALSAISAADYIVLGPGDLFTSTIANFAIGKMQETIAKSKAKIIFVINLMTKFGQTTDFAASDHVKTLEKYLGRHIDIVLINEPFKLAPEIVARYQQEKATIVVNDLKDSKEYKVIEGDFLSDAVYERSSADHLLRSIVRHDSGKLAKTIFDLTKAS